MGRNLDWCHGYTVYVVGNAGCFRGIFLDLLYLFRSHEQSYVVVLIFGLSGIAGHYANRVESPNLFDGVFSKDEKFISNNTIQESIEFLW